MPKVPASAGHPARSPLTPKTKSRPRSICRTSPVRAMCCAPSRNRKKRQSTRRARAGQAARGEARGAFDRSQSGSPDYSRRDLFRRSPLRRSRQLAKFVTPASVAAAQRPPAVVVIPPKAPAAQPRHPRPRHALTAPTAPSMAPVASASQLSSTRRCDTAARRRSGRATRGATACQNMSASASAPPAAPKARCSGSRRCRA